MIAWRRFAWLPILAICASRLDPIVALRYE